MFFQIFNRRKTFLITIIFTLVVTGVAACAVGYKVLNTTVADLIITHARIITGAGEVLDNSVLVVKDGRIAAIGKDTADRFSADETYDATGYTLLPGLIAVHEHVTLKRGENHAEGGWKSSQEEAIRNDLQAYLSRGFTTIYSPGDHLSISLAIREKAENTASYGPHYMIAGPIIGSNPHECQLKMKPCGYDAWAAQKDPPISFTLLAGEADRAMAHLAKLKVNFVKFNLDQSAYRASGLSPEESVVTPQTLRTLVKSAHDHGLKVGFHIALPNEMKQALLAGADRFVHIPALMKIQPGDNLPALLHNRGVSVASTLWVAEYLANEFSAENVDKFKRTSIDLGAAPDTVNHNARLLYDAGVTIAFGTDWGAYDSTKSVDRVLTNEINQLVKAGFSPAEIIQIVTRNGAQYLDILAETGTIDMGKRADLVIVRGNPLANIDALKQVALVVRDGEIVVRK